MLTVRGIESSRGSVGPLLADDVAVVVVAVGED